MNPKLTRKSRNPRKPSGEYERGRSNPLIVNRGGVINIRHCCCEDEPPDTTGEEECPGLPPEGACIPLALGSKPKQSREAKLQELLKSNSIPSALAAAFFQMARRYTREASAASNLETDAFRIFDSLPSHLQRVLECTVQTFEGLPRSIRDPLIDSEITKDPSRPLDADFLAERVSKELLARTSLGALDDKDSLENPVPGQVRIIEGDEGIAALRVNICRLNGLRTSSFSPQLTAGEYEPEETQQICTPEVVNGEVLLNCKVQTGDCPGNSVDEVCIHVPQVQAGESVRLEGVNFFNVQARVRLSAKAPGTTTREVEAHVCGDLETPITEEVDGFQRVIADCRVHDRILFRVPEDLPTGIYSIQIAQANTTGIDFGAELISLPDHFIEVVAPDDATFQIASEILEAKKETSPAFFGSDEVGLRIGVITIAENLVPGPLVEHRFPSNNQTIFGNVDSGNTREMNRMLFQGAGIGGVSLSIIGFEVDDQDVFEQQITEFQDAFVAVVQSAWQAVADAVGAVGGGVALAFGLSTAWASAIAAAIVLAILVVVALWAPADLIIEDVIGLSRADLSRLTSPNIAAPAVVEFTSSGGIDVAVEPVSKGVQYRERRKYRSKAEDSDYHITLRYNRLT